MNPRQRKLRLAKNTIRELTPDRASEAQGGDVIVPGSDGFFCTEEGCVTYGGTACGGGTCKPGGCTWLLPISCWTCGTDCGTCGFSCPPGNCA